MGEEFGPLAEPVCVDPFDSFSRTLMDLLSTRREQALVHGVLDKRVLEVVFLAAVLLLTNDQLLGLERMKVVREKTVHDRDYLHQLHGEAPADDRGDLEQCAGAFTEPVHPCHDEILN